MSAQALHLSGIVGMLVVSIASPTTAIMAGFFMIVFYLGEPFGRIPQPVVATQFSGMPTSTATGWYLAALAGSATLAGLLAPACSRALSRRSSATTQSSGSRRERSQSRSRSA
jgi:hypothetical protein